MDRVLVAAVIVVVAVVVAVVARRRRPDAPTQPARRVPAQLDRADFARPDAPWLVAVFTSATCHTCADVVAKAEVLASDDVAVVHVEWQARKDLHERYRIDGVPLLVIADAAGVVRGQLRRPGVGDRSLGRGRGGPRRPVRRRRRGRRAVAELPPIRSGSHGSQGAGRQGPGWERARGSCRSSSTG